MIHDPIPRADQPALPLFDEEALDIADYLREEGGEEDIHSDETRKHGVAALTLGAIGVVYGDIGTSPIYAFREALKATATSNPAEAEVLGILSLLIWTLILIVTVKYVFVLLRADNRGEGGILSLYTLVRRASGRCRCCSWRWRARRFSPGMRRSRRRSRSCRRSRGAR